jgi:hypothetical protein
MSLIMFDAVDVSVIPQDAKAVAGYCDGQWQTALVLKAAFPNAHLLTIAVFASDDADCLDVERFDATPQQAPGWVTRQIGRGLYRPVVYTSVSNVELVLGVLAQAGIGRSEVRVWAAHYTGVAHICGPSTCAYPGLTVDCDGCQFTDTARGLSLDESLLLPGFFDGPPKPPPVPAHIFRGDDMPFILPPGAGAVIALPVPRFVLGADATGAPAIVAPSVLRLCSNSPAQNSYMLDDNGVWLPFNLDYTRSPEELQLGGATVVKIQRTDKGPNLVTGDFA